MQLYDEKIYTLLSIFLWTALFFPITLVEQVELTFNAVAGGEQWTDRQGGNTDVQ